MRGELRVVHVITRLIVGGAQENTVASVLGLHAKPGISVSLLSGPTDGSEGSLEPCFRGTPEILSVVPSLVRPIHPWNDLRALRELGREISRRRPLNLTKSRLATLLQAIRRTNVTAANSVMNPGRKSSVTASGSGFATVPDFASIFSGY